MLFAAAAAGVVVLEDVFVARQLHRHLRDEPQDDRREQLVPPAEAIPLLLP